MPPLKRGGGVGEDSGHICDAGPDERGCFSIIDYYNETKLLRGFGTRWSFFIFPTSSICATRPVTTEGGGLWDQVSVGLGCGNAQLL